MSGFIGGALFASLDNAFPAVLVDVSAKVCVVFLLAAFMAIMLSRSSAAIRHLVWGIAFLAFLLLPLLSFAGPKWRVLPGWLGARNSAASSEGSNTPSAHRSSLEHTDDAGPRDLSPSLGTAPATPATDAMKPIAASAPGQPVVMRGFWDRLPVAWLVFVVWSIGFGLLLLRTGLSRLVLRHVLRSAEVIQDGPLGDEVRGVCRQLGISRPLNVYLSAQRGTPMTWGLLRTYLLLPSEASSWDQRRLHAVVLHELAHVKHYDAVTHALTQLIHALYWFHPCVWLAARRLRLERERACDDLVLRSGVKASDYAEDLLSLLVQRAIPCTALGISRPSELEGRLRAILNEKVSRQPITAGVLVLVLGVGALSTTGLAMLQAPDASATQSPAPPSAKLNAQAPERSRQPAPRVNAVCVDADGKPVPGAEVHLFQQTGGDHGHYVHSGPFTSDDQGKAVCAEALFSNDHGNFDRFIYARVPGRLVGVARGAKWTNRAAFNTEGRVKLQPSRSVEGQVAVPAGFDPTKVTVRVRTLQIITGPGRVDFEGFPRQHQFPGLDTALPEIFECRPDAEGRIRFSDVPVSGRLYLVTAADGLGEAQWWNPSKTFDQPIELKIEEESVVSGRVLSPDGKPAIGVNVTARLTPRRANLDFVLPLGGKPVIGLNVPPPPRRRQIGSLSSFRAVTDGDGRFAIHGLPQTEFDLWLQDPKKLWTFRPLETLLVEPRQDPNLALKMETGVRVTGRVVDMAGEPVKGVGFSVVADDNGGRGLSDDFTDANGRFEFLLPSGSARLYFNGVPDDFEYPKPPIVLRLDIKAGQADIENLGFTLPRKSDRGR